ncbi:hypothetical protein [Paenibacillus sp. RC67]|nr:hypothetical protein [Paenibacillus sp. RC67]
MVEEETLEQAAVRESERGIGMPVLRNELRLSPSVENSAPCYAYEGTV